MHIVHLTQSTTAEITGGVEYHVAYLTAALQRLGHQVTVVNTTLLAPEACAAPVGSPVHVPVNGSRRPADFLQRWDATLETAAMFIRRLVRQRHAARVAAHVANLAPDVVHQHGYVGELRACWLLAKKFPLVFTNHTGAYLHLDRCLPTRWLQRRWMRRFTMVIGPSGELTPRTPNGRYVPNGVDTATFFPLSTGARSSLAVTHDTVDRRVFLCARRWAPTKGIVHLARAMRRLPPSVKERSVFLFAGNATPGYRRYQQHVYQELAACGCDVRVLGNLEHQRMADLVNLADVCLLPSLMEATSLACLEAMACAKPVIGTRVGGLLELIRPGETGWLVPAGDEAALADAIREVSQATTAALQRIGANALEIVRARYTWEATALQTELIYQEALRARSAEDRRQGHSRGTLLPTAVE